MDHEIATAQRVGDADPGDVFANVRASLQLARAGFVGAAWRRLLGVSGHADLLAVVRDAQTYLARDHAQATVQELVACDQQDRRAMLKALAKCGATIPIVVLGCEPGVTVQTRADANVALRRLLTGDLAGWPPAWFLATIVDESPTAWATRDGSRRWSSDALRLVQIAVSRRIVELVPWLAALADRAIAAELRVGAAHAFLELTGQRRPPLDAADMTRRWRREGTPDG